MKIKIISFFSCLVVLSSINAFSYQYPTPEYRLYRMDKLSINGALGYLGGESNEYVYTQYGDTLSQLNWQINSAPIVKGEINVDFLPWLTGNVNGWSTMDTGKAKMDDYDWMNPSQSKWTHWSHHEDTDLNNAYNLDLNLRGWFLQSQQYKIGLTGGYQQEQFDFSAKGGCYQYANGLYSGCFQNGLAMIDYQQNFEATYLGLTGKYLMNNLELNATVKFSPWVHSSDIDEHYARNLTFTEESLQSTFSSVSVGAGYFLSPFSQVFVEAAYNQFSNGKADTVINDNNGDYFLINNSAGLGNTNYTLALGLKYAAG